ncbi:alpha/beta fold hydrolase [Streptomyces sp. NPDC054863]
MTSAGPTVPVADFTPAAGPESAAGAACALVFAPVIPQWDGGAFFTPVIHALTTAGLRVRVVDTLAAWDESIPSMEEFADRWHRILTQYEDGFGTPQLICGNALGGALAQALLTRLAPETAALLVSGPAVTDTLLDSRLTEIAELAEDGALGASLALLDHYVKSHGTEPAGTGRPGLSGSRAASAPLAAGDRAAAARRIAGGMRLLTGSDVSAAVVRHPGPLLSIVGADSQLVARRHTAAAPHHRIEALPDTGMRPHAEHPEQVSSLITTFLAENGPA